PFLSFLIEVDWPNGNLLREYTVLLDPPELTREAPPATEAPEAEARVEEAAAPAEPARPEKTAEPVSGETLSYGPVQEDDTLWSIAEQIRPDDSVSVPQVMMALLEANPEAFYDNNVNRLKAGAVLRLEDRGLIRQMGRAEASAQLREQTRAWRDYKERAAAEAQRREPSEATAKAPAGAAAGEGSRLEVVAPEGEDKTPSGAPAAAEPEAEAEGAELEKLRRELMRAQETAEAQRSENEELRGRLEELEGQLASIQRLLTLQNEELTRLQRQLGQEPQPIEPPEQAETGEVEAPATGKGPSPGPEAETKPEPEKPSPKQTPAPAPTSGPSVTGFVSNLLDNPVVAGALAIVGISVLALVGLIIRRRRGGGHQESILTGETSSMARSRQGEGAPSEESSLPSDLAFSGMESIQADESEVDPVIEADVYLSYGRNQQAEELLKRAIDQDPNRQELRVKLLETYYKTGNKESFLAEAENVRDILEGQGPQWERVAAMGHELAPEHPLFAQAPEGEVIAEDDERRPAEDDVMDIGLDLDALAAEMEPSEEEAAAASEFGDFDLSLPDLEGGFGTEEEKAQGDAGSPREEDAGFGGEELDFGAETEPKDETTFAGLGGDEAPSAEEPGPFDLGEVEEPVAGAPETGVPEVEDAQATEGDEEKGGLEFELGDFELPSEEPETPSEGPSAAGGDENAMEFDLSGLDLGEEPVAEPGQPEPQPEADGLDFEPGGLAAEEPEAATEAGGAEAGEGEGGLEFDLGGLELPESGGEGDEAAAGGASEEQEPAGGMGLDWDLGESAGGEGESAAGEAGGEEDVFAGMDDAATKLDLARAYADMGDSDAARNMLEEVIQEGTSSQQEQAQQLLDRLG
ncbi:MAG TPA: FimV/HubP family polar landmark protein, partial [Gammaproteobacteria bacterium]|nr:FimV/HubP family polar landmark protein [Gammaproteobacteria bacterium]